MSKIEEVARAQKQAAEEWLAKYLSVYPETASYVTIAIVPERVRALAAIRALREPDEGMTGAGAHHLTGHVAATCCHRTGGHGGLGTAPHCECREVFVDTWQAAIDFILSEAGEKP